jgi:transcriptional regulator with XRE-family HTH domain
MSTATKPKHIGRNISRIREMHGMKQEALAIAIGVSQQTISIMENSEDVEEEKLVEVAKVLGVTTEAIKNFSEEAMITYFNTFNDGSLAGSAANFGNNNHNECTFHPLDKMMEIVDENRKLYERLLEAEKEKNSYLEKLLNIK